jgi:hypothetical protein
MPGGLSKHQLSGIKKTLGHDYLAEKERKKQKRRERAAQGKKVKGERHKSRQQEIEELVENELELEGGGSDE